MKYSIDFTNRFKKDLKLAEKQGHDVGKLLEVVHRLADDEVLEPKYRDHALTGNYRNYRECHIEPDWLLIYQKVEDVLILVLYRAGSHSELFK